MARRRLPETLYAMTWFQTRGHHRGKWFYADYPTNKTWLKNAIADIKRRGGVKIRWTAYRLDRSTKGTG